jgi:hypothetical protein
VIAAIRATIAGLLADRRIRIILGLAAVGAGTTVLRGVEREWATILTDLEQAVDQRAAQLHRIKAEILGQEMTGYVVPEQPAPGLDALQAEANLIRGTLDEVLVKPYTIDVDELDKP